MIDVKLYNKWRIRILYSIIIGYATFYLCRQNLSVIIPALEEEFQINNRQLGWILTNASIVYGFGKFFNGFLSDKTNPRFFLFLGLIISSICTFFSGFCGTISAIAVFCMLNNWAQSMGWPPIARMLTHWFAPKELGFKWALGATSHQIGSAITIVFCGYLVEKYSWQMAFFVPGLLAFLIAFLLYERLRGSPKSVGLPDVEQYKPHFSSDIENINNSSYDSQYSTKSLLTIVFFNKNMWYICFANMFLYIIRSGILFWAPMFLKELKNMSLIQAGWKMAGYEIFGMLGGIVAGILSDRVFNRSSGITGAIFMLCLSFVLMFFWHNSSVFYSVFALMISGFFVYGPQVLIGVSSANLTNKKAVGTANGFASIFAYIGSAIAGAPTGFIVDEMGWDFVFLFFILSSLMGSFCFIMINFGKK